MTAPNSFGDLLLDAVRFRLAAPMQRTKLNTYPGKITIGDYTEDSDPRLSLWGIVDLSAGHGVGDIREGVDQARCRWSTLQTRYPGMIAPPPLATQYTAAADTTGARPLGDLYESGTYRFYAAYGTKLVKWSEAGPSFGASLGTLVGTPVNKAVEFVGTGTRRLFIPCGTAGYSTWDGAALDNTNTGKLAKAFCLWDRDAKLVMLDTDGHLWYSTDGTAWTDWSTVLAAAKLDASYIPRNLVTYFDQASNPAVFVITNRGALAFDPNGPALYPVESLDWPPHPYQALGSAKWRGYLYISVGMGTRRYTGDVATPMGLDRDEGLPANYRGRVLEMEPETNGLYQLCLGGESGSTAYPHLQVWTDFGWHTVWAEATTARTTSKITGVRVSEAQGVHSLWFADGTGNLRRIKLPVDDANPRQQIEASTGDFASGDFELQTGRFDAGMPGYDKVANLLTVKMAGHDTTGTGITVYYRINGALSWTTLGTSSFWPEADVASFSLNGFGSALTHHSLTNDYGGLLFRDIEFKFAFNAGGGATDGYIRAISFYFMKVQPPGRAWTATLDLSAGMYDQSPATLIAKLDALMDAGLFFEAVWRDNPATNGSDYVRVKLTSVDAQEPTGYDERTLVNIGLLEVPDNTGVSFF